MTRWSMPSNRPQTIRGPGPAASSTTRDWVNGRPRGLISRRGRSGAISAASMASASTSARSTMPGPPPAGVSSTLRWRSVAEARISRASSAHRPDASALPARLTPSGPGNISGNRVSTVARQVLASNVLVSEVMAFLGASRSARQTRIDDAPGVSAPDLDQASPRSLLLAAILDEFDRIVDHQMLVRPHDKGAFDPMIDHGRVPGLRLSRPFSWSGRWRCVAEYDVSILNVSNVPAFVVMVSCPTTFELPDRFQMLPLPALTSLDSNIPVLPTAFSGG